MVLLLFNWIGHTDFIISCHMLTFMKENMDYHFLCKTKSFFFFKQESRGGNENHISLNFCSAKKSFKMGKVNQNG